MSLSARARPSSQMGIKKANKQATIEDLFKELTAIKYKVDVDDDEHVKFVQKCQSICAQFDLSAESFVLKLDAFKYTRGIKARLTLEELDKLAAHIGEQVEAERRKASSKQPVSAAGGIRVKMEPPGASQGGRGLIRASQPSSSSAGSRASQAFDHASLTSNLRRSAHLEDMDDLYGDAPVAAGSARSGESAEADGYDDEEIVLVKKEPGLTAASPAKKPKRKSDSLLDGGDDEDMMMEEDSKEGESSRKRQHVGEDGEPLPSIDENGEAASPVESSTPSTSSLAPVSQLLRPSFAILSATDAEGKPKRVECLFSARTSKYAQRSTAGQTAAAFNDTNLARLEASEGELSAEEAAERAKRIVEIEVFQPVEDLLAESSPEEAAASAAAAAASAAAAAPKVNKYLKKKSSTSSSMLPTPDSTLFRYMYQNEDELRETLEHWVQESQSIMLDKPALATMRALATATSATAPASSAAAAAAKVVPLAPVVVKKEAEEEKKAETVASPSAAESTPPATAASVEPTPAASSSTEEKKEGDASSTPVASSSSSAAAASSSAAAAAAATPAPAAAAAAAPIVVDDDDENVEPSLVPLVGVGSSKGQHSVLLAGRVVYDANDTQSEGSNNELVQKLSNTHSVWLEGDRGLSEGARIQMRLNGLRGYSLFPGQVVLAKGVNTSGLSFVAEDVFTDASLPHMSLARSVVEKANASLGVRPLGLMVAAGPFTTSEDLSYAPLWELLREVRRVRPDTLLLQGPFVDADHPALASHFSQMNLSYEGVTMALLHEIVGRLRGLGVKLLIQPSTRDAGALPIFPQPAFMLSGELASELGREVASGRLTLLPNPASFRLNDVLVASSSQDIISALSNGNEIHKVPLGKNGAPMIESQGRLQRLASHLITSHSFYPLFPAPDGTHLDYSHASNFKMHATPDLLILPSKTKYFAQPVFTGGASSSSTTPSASSSSTTTMEDTTSSTPASQGQTTIVVNPQSLTMGPSGGTYALVSIHPLKDEEMVPPPNSNRLTDHCMLSRTRVDILRI